jgi:hypothetical protein
LRFFGRKVKQDTALFFTKYHFGLSRVSRGLVSLSQETDRSIHEFILFGVNEVHHCLKLNESAVEVSPVRIKHNL